MEAPEGPPRFTCPPEFSLCLFCPGAPFSQETLQGPSKELWLIRAPANFSPESLDGCSIPLQGSQSLKVSQSGGTEKIFHVQMALEHCSGARLLLPPDHGDHLTCSQPFSSSLSICERYGDSSNNQPLFTLAARPPPQIPAGLKQRFLPFGNSPDRAVLPRAQEEPPKKKKKKKKHRMGEGDSEDQLPPWGETAGAAETEASDQHEMDGPIPLEMGSQPGSVAVAQNIILSGEPEDLAPLSKKKKKRKEDKLKEVVGEEAEAGLCHEDGAATLPVDSQTSPAANAPSRLLPGEAEELSPRVKKKKKKQKEGRELEEETRGEAKVASLHQVDETMPTPQPNPTVIALDGLVSGEVEDLVPSRKKKKKKRKEDREVEETRMEAEAMCPHENSTTPRTISPQPNSGLIAQDRLPSGEAEEPASIGKKKKKKRKEGQEGKKMEGEAEGLLDLESCLGPHSESQAGEDSLPGMEAVTQDTQKEKSSKERAASPELFSSQEDTIGRSWDCSMPEGELVLAKENLMVCSSSHKAKKRKKEKPA